MISKINYELNERIHPIILNPYLSLDDFKINCELINKYNIKNISSSLNFLSDLKDIKFNQKVKINTYISYPFGDLPHPLIKQLSTYAKDLGVDGIEYTPKFFLLSKNQDEDFAKDIENIKDSELPITLIFNRQRLNNECFEQALKISIEMGITSFQMGDGFGTSIERNDINEIRKILGNNKFIKVAGNIKDLKDVIELLDQGVDFIGTSYYHKIFESLKNN